MQVYRFKNRSVHKRSMGLTLIEMPDVLNSAYPDLFSLQGCTLGAGVGACIFDNKPRTAQILR